MLPAAAPLLGLLPVAVLALIVSRSQSLRDFAAAAIGLVLPTLTAAALACSALYQVLSP